jgi:nucleoside-diphosphate-sugar epimerase
VTRIGLTGISGFLGKPLANALLAKGYTVRALVNSSPVESAPGLEIAQGSLDRPETLPPFVKDIDILIHCAGLVAAKKDDDFYEINVRGTRSLIKALDVNKTIRCLYVSSLAARHAKVSPYAESKRLGEKVIEGFKTRDYDILRPPAIYGPGDTNMIPLFRMMQKNFALHVGYRESRFSMIYIDDAVQAIMKWVESGKTTQKSYEIADYKVDGYSWSDFTSCAAKVMDQDKPVTIRLPAVPAYAIGYTIGGINKILQKKSFINQNKVRELCYKDWVTHNRTFEEQFQWKPTVSLLDGMKKTVDWYYAEGKLDKNEDPVAKKQVEPEEVSDKDTLA